LAKKSALQILPSTEYEGHPFHSFFLLIGQTHVPVNVWFYILHFWNTLPALRSLETTFFNLIIIGQVGFRTTIGNFY
jgi:ABC-type uncharacterized transport system permease subunit